MLEKGNEMRKFMILPLAGSLALGFAGPVAAAPNISNTSGGGESIYGEWSSDGTYGYVFLAEATGYGGSGEIYQEAGEWVLCPPTEGAPVVDKPAPMDTTPGDEYYGFVGTRTWGYAYDVTIDFSRRMETGSATGSVELYTDTVDECNGDYGDDPVAEVGTLAVDVTGVGPLASFRWTSHYKIPSQFNGHENYRGKERQAIGSIVAGSSIDADFGAGYIQQVTWTVHTN